MFTNTIKIQKKWEHKTYMQMKMRQWWQEKIHKQLKEKNKIMVTFCWNAKKLQVKHNKIAINRKKEEKNHTKQTEITTRKTTKH